MTTVRWVCLTSIALAVSFGVATWLATGSFALTAVAAPAALLLIANSTATRVCREAKTVAIVRALGATRGQIYRTMLGAATLEGVLGSVIGGGAGMLVASMTGPWRGSTFWVPILMSLGAILTVLATYVSINRVVSRSAISGLAFEPARVRRGPVGIAVGVVATAIGLAAVVINPPGLDVETDVIGALLVWLGLILLAPLIAGALLRMVFALASRSRLAQPVNRLAVREAIRHPRRTAALVSSMITGVSVVWAFAEMEALLGLVLVVAAFDLGRTVMFADPGRGSEIEVMREVGASRPFIRRAVRREHALVVACGGLVGLGLGLLLTVVLAPG